MPPDERGRPGQHARDGHQQTTATRSTASVAYPTSEVGNVHEAVNGALVVVVTTPAGRYRRRVYLSLRAAEAAVDRAERRGQVARIALCSLLPVRVIGGE